MRTQIGPVVGAAGFAWNSSGFGHHERIATALFEADVAELGNRYPDLWPGNRDVEEGYPCIDLWISSGRPSWSGSVRAVTGNSRRR